MLTVTVGITILKELMADTLLDATAEQQEIWRRVSQHKIAVSEDLVKQYIEYCEEKLEPVYTERIQLFLSNIIGNKERCLMVNPQKKAVQFEDDKYLNKLVEVCVNTKDRILLDEQSKIRKTTIEKNNIQLFEKKDMMNIDLSRNIFTMFTFPVISHQISPNEDSKKLGQWIGRILSSQKEFTIYDNYIGTSSNIKNLQKYILKYIPENSYISIITIETEKVKENDLKKEFSKDFYKKWNIEVFLVKNKKESHPRVISMPEYQIILDKGIQTFGVNGKTESSMITIKQSDFENRYFIKTTKKIYP